MTKIAITTSSFAQYSEKPLRMLRKAGVEYVLNPFGRTLDSEEAIEIIKGCVGIAAGTEPINDRVIDASPDLRVISRCGTGMDNIDLEHAKRRGITIRNTPDGPTQAVAELTVALALNLLRNVSMMDREMKNGIWKKRMGSLISGKRIGVIGFGRIGKAVGSMFSRLGSIVGYYDPLVESKGFEKMDLDDLLSWVDVLTLHCSRNAEGNYVIGLKEMKKMKKGAWLINASRGGVIDEDALYEMLKEKDFSGAALDVFEGEPYRGRLAAMPNVILTPHIGSYAMESRIQMEVDTIRNLLEELIKFS